MEMLRKSRGVIALMLFVAAGGCRQVENPGKVFPQSPTVEETRSKEIGRNQPEDIPVPRDMEYVTRENKSFYSATARVGRFHYWGNVPADEVAVFFRERMPQRPYGWTLVNEQAHGPTTTMHFQKGSERCEVSIGPQDAATVAVINLNAQSR